jgi:hypothetical protein
MVQILRRPCAFATGTMQRMATPAGSPQPAPHSAWRDWWKFPLFFGVIVGAIALEAFLNTKGGALLLLLLVYLAGRGFWALARKRPDAKAGRKPDV